MGESSDKDKLLDAGSLDVKVISGNKSSKDETPSFLRSGKARVVLCILFCELCERLTYYSIIGNLVIYCTNELGYSSATSAALVSAFSGTSYFVPVFGGWIADSVAGKYNTIYGGLLIYFIGAAILPVISFNYSAAYSEEVGLTHSQQQGYFIVGLILVAIGTGGIKANVGPFGAQQMEDLGPGAVHSFFNWFYWFINVGSGIAFSAIVYIQQEVGFGVGFLIPAITILLSLVLLVVSRNKYHMKPPEGSILTQVVKVLYDAVRGCRNAPVEEGDTCLDRAKVSRGGRHPDHKVDEVKDLWRVIPVFITVIIYWTIYIQMSATYLLQGERMKLIYGGFTIPVAALNLFNIAIILILVPIMDRFVYPWLERHGCKLSMLKRMGIGMLLAAGSMLVAALVEISRKNIMRDGGFFPQTVAGVTYNASELSVFAQIPQYTLIGGSEVFTSITGLAFAYSQSPESMQGVVMGLFLLTSGLGSYLGSLLVLVVNAASNNTWLPDEINGGHLEYFYFFLAGLMMVDFFFFLLVAHRYRYVKGTNHTEEANGILPLPDEYAYISESETLLNRSGSDPHKENANHYTADC